MTGTVYTIHRAEDAEILATANPSNLQQVAANVARSLATSGDRQSRYAYVHNGTGVIAAAICRSGEWHDAERADFAKCFPYCEAAARAKREAAGWPND